MNVLQHPLELNEIQKQQNENGFISGIISLPFTSAVNMESEIFLEELSDLLTDSNLLSNIHYEMVGSLGQNVILQVTGDATLLLSLNEVEEQKYEAIKYVRASEETSLSKEQVEQFTGHSFNSVEDIPKMAVITQPDGTAFLISTIEI